MSEQLEHPVCRLSISDGLLVYRYTQDAHVDLTAAREVIALGTQLAKGEPMRALVDISGVVKVDRDARIFFAESPENRAITQRVAMLINSPLSRMIGNFFLGLNKPKAPTKLFTKESEALAWLQER